TRSKKPERLQNVSDPSGRSQWTAGRRGFSLCFRLSQDLFCNPVRIDRRREAAVDGDLPQHRGEFFVRQPVADRPPKMRLELVHPAKTSDHPKIEQAAVARLEIVVAPHRAPREFVQEVLEFAIEVGGVGDGAVDILVAEHPAAHADALFVESLVHCLKSPARHISRLRPSWQSPAADVYARSSNPTPAKLQGCPPPGEGWRRKPSRVAKPRQIRYLE